MLKSVNQWCFPEGTALDKVFSVSQQAGLDAVELNLYASGAPAGFTMDTTAAEAEGIAKQAAEHGLKLRSLSTGLLWGAPLSSADADERKRGRAIVGKQLEIAELIGADTVLVVPGAVNENSSYDDCYANSQRELELLIPEAERRGVKIGIENVWNKFLLSPLEMKRYVDELDSPNVGVYFDVGNILLYGYPEQWIRILGSRIAKIHVKDFKTSAGNFSGFVPLMAGDVNWPGVIAALKEIGYTDTLTAEISPYPSNAYQAVYDTANQLEAIINGG